MGYFGGSVLNLFSGVLFRFLCAFYHSVLKFGSLKLRALNLLFFVSFLRTKPMNLFPFAIPKDRGNSGVLFSTFSLSGSVLNLFSGSPTIWRFEPVIFR